MPDKGTRIDRIRRLDREAKARRRVPERIAREDDPSRRFVGVDGEGGNRIVDGHKQHFYFLLRAGKDAIHNGEPLTTEECLSFLADLPKGGLQYVAYYFDYDVTMILRSLPPERLHRLLNRQLRTNKKNGAVLPVDVLDEFQIDYLPHKEFKVKRNGGEWTVIQDVGSFFQCAFVKALDLWEVGSVEQREAIAADKAMRSEFGELTDHVIEYNALECDLLESLMSKFRAVCQGIGYIPRRWEGPGNLASAMMQRHRIPRRQTVLERFPGELWDAANSAYYGGRFETGYAGSIDEPVHQWDINSAYPAAILELPCLEHGEFTYHEFDRLTPVSEAIRQGKLFLARGTFIGEGPRAAFYGFPVRRKDGSIHFPEMGNGWYWSIEIAGAVHQSFQAREVWQYEKRCDCVPFHFIPEVYETRRRIGKTTKGMVLKLALNSLYGKLAQSIGAAPYANPIWASLITAITRAKLGEVIHDPDVCGKAFCGEDVVMLATDGVYTINDRPNITPDKKLGGWDLEIHDSMFIVQPGVYFGTVKADPKTRGLPMGKVREYEEQFRQAWNVVRESGDLSVTVSVPVSSFVGLRLGMHRRRSDLLGQWQHICDDPMCDETNNHIHKDVSFDWRTKRRMDRTAIHGHAVRTYPYEGDPTEPNYPYSKEIGAWREVARMDFIDTPPEQGVLF